MAQEECAPRRIAVIPAYEPPESFASYAAELAAAVDALVVVDDGSAEKYRAVFEKIRALPQTTVLSCAQNRGKGHALKCAFEYCAQRFFDRDVLITADCDGQHDVQDVLHLAQVCIQQPQALILGCRDFSLPNVPRRSYAGNTQMCRILRAARGIDLKDTQTGLRAFTVRTARRMLHLSGERFEYETHMLLWAAREGVPFREVPVRTIYPTQEEEHVSHYRTLRDTGRIFRILIMERFGARTPRFCGGAARLARGCMRLFSRRYRCEVTAPQEAVVYVCRHMDMHGPYTTLKWLPFDVHPMVLSVFLDAEACEKHFREFTFSVREGKPVPRRDLRARVAGRVCAGVTNSLAAIPVHRSGTDSLITMRRALKMLLRGESLIVYPDIEYRASGRETVEIYTGFLYLGEMYRKKTGSSLRFVPLSIDENRRCIAQGDPVWADRYKTDADAAAAVLKASMYAEQKSEANRRGKG